MLYEVITPQKRNNIFPVKSNNEAKVSTSSIQLQKEDRIIRITSYNVCYTKLLRLFNRNIAYQTNRLGKMIVGYRGSF